MVLHDVDVDDIMEVSQIVVELVDESTEVSHVVVLDVDE